ncbi:hypothetical protein [Collimonas fungivorans]|uniref:hypothetical protein n=1 Tax=Collimonas fungivorans TaxID=158899 RepID=UPI003FA3D5AE
MKSQQMYLTFLVAIALVISVPGHCDELSERASMNKYVKLMMQTQNVTELEALSSTYLSTQARTSSGIWKLTVFNTAISLAFDSRHKGPAYWALAEKWARNWVEHYPESPAAHIAYAQMLLNHGWSFRGTGYAKDVEAQNWAPFAEYTQQARTYLETHKTIAAKDPSWYELMAVVAKQQSWPEREFSKLINEGLERYPAFYQIYFAAIGYYGPKWGGNAESIEKFAQAALKRTQSSEGFGMYARIYWVASQTNYDDRLFSDSLVDWPVMKKGIDDVLKKYPDNWNINNFARFACLSGDKKKTAELISRMDTPPLMAAWDQISDFQQCKDWAYAEQATSDKSLHTDTQ